MSPMPTLSRPLRRRLLERLERLHQALAGLARRLREAVAALAGEHAGAAVRDAVAAALGHAAPAPPAPEPPRYGRPSYHDPYPYDPGDAPYRGEDPNDFWGEPPPAPDPPPPPAEARPASRRWPLLPAAPWRRWAGGPAADPPAPRPAPPSASAPWPPSRPSWSARWPACWS